MDIYSFANAMISERITLLEIVHVWKSESQDESFRATQFPVAAFNNFQGFLVEYKATC
jgi:hypothetical protein